MSKNVVAISNFKRNRRIKIENQIKNQKMNSETAQKVNEVLIEKKREENLGKISKWEDFRKRRAQLIDTYLFRKKNQKIILEYL